MSRRCSNCSLSRQSPLAHAAPRCRFSAHRHTPSPSIFPRRPSRTDGVGVHTERQTYVIALMHSPLIRHIRVSGHCSLRCRAPQVFGVQWFAPEWAADAVWIPTPPHTDGQPPSRTASRPKRCYALRLTTHSFSLRQLRIGLRQCRPHWPSRLLSALPVSALNAVGVPRPVDLLYWR